MTLPAPVVIGECCARDGLQNEDAFVSTDRKVRFVEAAAEAGFPKIEAASYAHPKYLPQFADTEEVLRRIRRKPGVAYLGLVPNEKGLQRRPRHRALGEGLTVIGGIATSFGCPIQGDVPFQAVADLAAWYADLGAREILFGDTTGVANPVQVEAFFA